MRRFRARDGIAFAIVALMGLVAMGNPPATHEPVGWSDWRRSSEEKRLDRIDQMVDSGVKVLYGSGHGSGVLFVRGEDVYVLTAAHVVKDGNPNQPFGWGWVPQQLVPGNGITYGKRPIWIHRHRQSETVYTTDVFAAEIVAVDGPTDAAILKIKNATPENFPDLEEGATFDLRNNKSLRRGMKTIHVGNFNQSKNAVTDGIISNPQQVLEYASPPLPKFRVIQTTNMCAPGSSGGGVYLESNGKCIGILVRTTWMPGDGLVIPVYEIDQWLNDVSEEMGKLLEQPE